MSKLNLKRPKRVSVIAEAGEFNLRPLSAMDISELVKKFDAETVELTVRVINHVQTQKPLHELFTDPTIFMDMIGALPDLICSAITLCAGGDEEDEEAVREMSAEDIALVAAKLVSISLERVGGLGNFLDLMRTATVQVREAFEAELQKTQGIAGSSESGARSRSSGKRATKTRKTTPSASSAT